MCALTDVTQGYRSDGGDMGSVDDARDSGGLTARCIPLLGAIVGSVIPITERLSKDVHWTTVEQMSALLACTVLTPLALLVWAMPDLDGLLGVLGLWAGIISRGERMG